MAAMVSEIKAIDPLSLKEAMGQPDYSKLETAIHKELNNLQKAGAWTIVERPKDRNIVRNKWVFRIKEDAAEKIKQYKARLITKGVHGKSRKNSLGSCQKGFSLSLRYKELGTHVWSDKQQSGRIH